MTTLETAMLNAIAYHEMCTANGATPQDIEDTGTYCWVEDFAEALNISVPVAKGVLGSLAAKKLLTIQEHDERDNVVYFTDAGFAAWQQNDTGNPYYG